MDIWTFCLLYALLCALQTVIYTQVAKQITRSLLVKVPRADLITKS